MYTSEKSVRNLPYVFSILLSLSFDEAAKGEFHLRKTFGTATEVNFRSSDCLSLSLRIITRSSQLACEKPSPSTII